ncbi:MAG: GerW family sporulation protein [Eubacteriales bacterium]
MNQINLTENLDALFHSLENFTQKEGVIGKAVTQNEKTMMPIVSITVGYGGGNVSMGKDQSGSAYSTADSGSGALGFGAKLCTDAILIIDTQQNVSILPMTAGAASTQIIDKIPQIINGMKQNAQPGPTA